MDTTLPIIFAIVGTGITLVAVASPKVWEALRKHKDPITAVVALIVVTGGAVYFVAEQAHAVELQQTKLLQVQTNVFTLQADVAALKAAYSVDVPQLKSDVSTLKDNMNQVLQILREWQETQANVTETTTPTKTDQ